MNIILNRINFILEDSYSKIQEIVYRGKRVLIRVNLVVEVLLLEVLDKIEVEIDNIKVQRENVSSVQVPLKVF